MKSVLHGLAAAFVLATAAALSPVPAAASYTFQSLYSFCSSLDCSKGQYPHGILNLSGKLYGTTSAGGVAGVGVVFEFSPSEKKSGYRVLYSFCARANCADGANPEGPLIVDEAGNLYGTTDLGGKRNLGTIFKLTPNGKGNKWALTVLYDFGAQPRDGSYPLGALAYQGRASGAPYDGVSPLFGLTEGGGYPSQGGTVFELQAPADKESKSKWD
ncbi:MAG: choice-of-anchor tandem repeat GloVer-containing protein [Rhizomicrobium sp.]